MFISKTIYRPFAVASSVLLAFTLLGPVYVDAAQSQQFERPPRPPRPVQGRQPRAERGPNNTFMPQVGGGPRPTPLPTPSDNAGNIAEALTGLSGNGHLPLGTPNDEAGGDTFYAAKKVFDTAEDVADGLGPVYNAQACRECHQVPMSGGSSQVSVVRAGRFANGSFFAHPGGSLIQDRAIDPAIQEVIQSENDIVALRMSLSILGDGYVEAIADDTLRAIAAAQPLDIRGTYVMVDVLEAPGTQRIGRFGWKDQHASLLSFAADAYLNEMGITSPLQPTENTSNGRSVAAYDSVTDPEEQAGTNTPFGEDVHIFADFMRSLGAPPRDTATMNQPDVVAGQALFNQVGCQMCHTAEIKTAPVGSVLNGGYFTVTAALGDKLIRPYGDFLLHNIGTGDGIYQTGPSETRNMLRTAPLWGLRTRSRYMHDGLNYTLESAIQRHAGQALSVRQRFDQLTPDQKRKVMAFLRSL